MLDYEIYVASIALQEPLQLEITQHKFGSLDSESGDHKQRLNLPFHISAQELKLNQVAVRHNSCSEFSVLKVRPAMHWSY